MTHLKKKWLFFIHTLVIWACYIAMFYVCFFAFEPTAHLSINVGFACFVAGSFGMVAPTNGGMGAWQAMVFIGLTTYGVLETDAKTYANVAFVILTLISIIFGALCTAIFPYVNKGVKTNS